MFELIADIADRVKSHFPELNKGVFIAKKDAEGRVLEQKTAMNEFTPLGIDDRSCDYFYIRHRESEQVLYEQTDEGRYATCERVQRATGQFRLVIVTDKVDRYSFEDRITRALISLDSNDRIGMRDIDIEILESETDSITVANAEAQEEKSKGFDPKLNLFSVDFDLVFTKVEMAVPGPTNENVSPQIQDNKFSVLMGGLDENLFRNEEFNGSDNQGTFNIWIDPVILDGNDFIFSVGGGNVGNPGVIGLRVTDFGGTSFLNTIYRAEGDGGDFDIVRGSTPIVTGQYYFFSWGSGGSMYSLWVDSVPQTLTVESGGNNGQWFNDQLFASPVTTLGCVQFDGSFNQHFNAYFDEWTYFNNLFTDNEIEELYNNGIPSKPTEHSCAANLKNYVRFGDNPNDNFDIDVVDEWRFYDQISGFNVDSINMEGDEVNTNVPG